jgi:quinol-cytochrome oxidoreductase complex cytochrome b subunit
MNSGKEHKKFYPFFLFEITVVTLFTIEAVLVLAVLFPSNVGREIDFSAPYQPRPEWYFLFLYQLTKYFPGKWTFIGAVLLPGIAFSAALLAPFLDSGPAAELSQRKTAAAFGFGLLGFIIALTVVSLL